MKKILFSVLLFASISAHAGDIVLHGFGQVGYASRITGAQPAGNSGDFMVGGERLQLSLSGSAPSGTGDFLAKADFFHDNIEGKAGVEIREIYIDIGKEDLEARIGRQIITWGTGDLIFINDVFPKDWAALFTGKPLEYLKLGSDVLKINFYFKDFGFETVTIPAFEPDHLPSSDRFFLYDPFSQVSNRTTSKPMASFENAELAVKISRPLSSWDASIYVARGFYRIPIMMPDNFTAPTQISMRYPKRNVYGASVRGSGLGGALNLEGGYYDSREDQDGSNSLIPNSQALYLLGYQRQLGEDLSGGIQYYGETMMNHNRYLANLPSSFPAQDKLRQLLTLRMTKFLKYQTWKLSLFGYYSPTDEDFYLIPEVWHSLADGLWVSLGSNIFGGEKETTFFGQFDKNDNLYVNMRYEF